MRTSEEGDDMKTTISHKGTTTMKRTLQRLENRLLLGHGYRFLLIAAIFLLAVPAAWAIDLMHNSSDTGSTKWPQGWGVAGGKYGQFTCATCHEPYAENLKGVRRTIGTMNGDTWPNGQETVTVRFQNLTGQGRDYAGRATSDRICEVCHSRTDFHNYNAVNNSGGNNHPTPTAVCTSCHSHNTGFKAACGGCHGNPPTAMVFGGDYGMVNPPSNALTPGEVGAHLAHKNRNMVCDTCHYINNDTIKMPNLSRSIDIGFFGFGGKVTSGVFVPYSARTPHPTYKFKSGTPNTTIAAVATTYATANKCTNVYCHGGGSVTNGKPPLTGGTNTTPKWDAVSQNACGSCHGATPANPPTMGSHLKHSSSAAGYGYECDLCHPAIDMSHVQGNLRWAMKTSDARVGSAAAYNGSATGATGDLAPSASYGQCAGVACHSDGKGGLPRLVPTWGDTNFNVECAGCHNGNGGSVAPMASGMHAQHINQSAVNGVNFACSECHAKTVSGDRTIANRLLHNNGLVNYSGARAGKNPVSCATAYCHTDGKGNAGSSVSWSTGPAIVNCAGCHGAASPADFTSVYGEPNYVNGGPGAFLANSHRMHIGSAAASSCFYCHKDTVNGAGILSGATHLDRTIQVAAGDAAQRNFTYTPGLGNKSCAAIMCHGAGAPTVKWGQSLDCAGCHGGSAASAPNDIKSGKHAQHINQVSVNGEAYGCVECHAQVVSTDSTFSNRSRHADFQVNYSGARAGSSTSTCNAAYCHSDGKGGQGIAVDWYGGPPLANCKGCHGAASSADFTSIYGEPNYLGTGPQTPRANSHRKHVGTSGAATCVFCHAATIQDGSGLLKESGTHIDRSVQVVNGGGKTFTYNPAPAEKSCSTISCHGSTTTYYWGGSMPVDCTGCHGGNVDSGAVIATGLHPQHINQQGLNGLNFGCVECHAQTVSGDRSVSSQGNHGNQLINYSGAKAGKNPAACQNAYCHSSGKGGSGLAVNWTTGPALTNCIGCHGVAATPDFASVAGEPNYPNEGSGLPGANSHKAHTKNLAQTGAASCEICHVTTVTTSGTAIQSSGLHIDGTITVQFNTSKAGVTASYTASSKTCNTIACHGGSSPRWGASAGAGCNGCHPNLSATHARHIGDLATGGTVSYYNFTSNRSSGAVYRFGCATCHPTDTAKHRNGQVDITFNRNKTGAGSLVLLNNLVTADTHGYSQNSGSSVTCSLVYCHSNGRLPGSQVEADFKLSPNWFGGTLPANRCGGCHDNPPQYAGQSHYVASSSMGDDGRGGPYRETGHMIGIHPASSYAGNNQNGYLRYSSSGNVSHGNPAVATTIGCYICHSGIVSSSTIDTYTMNGATSIFACGNCHTGSTRTPLQPGQIVGAGLHVNGSKDVVFAPITFKTKAQLANVANALGWSRNGTYKASDSYDSFNLGVSTWNSASKSCMTACHVNQSGIVWGAQLQCLSCHANQ